MESLRMEPIYKQAKRVQRLRWEQLESGIITVMVWKKEITNLMTNLQKAKTKTLWVSVFFFLLNPPPKATAWECFTPAGEASSGAHHPDWTQRSEVYFESRIFGVYESILKYVKKKEQKKKKNYCVTYFSFKTTKVLQRQRFIGTVLGETTASHCLRPLTHSLTTGPTEQAVESIRRKGTGEFI